MLECGMRRKVAGPSLAAAVALTIVAAPAAAQHTDHATHAAAGVIKALTTEQIAAHLNGEGMGLAVPAELNHYPGPKHVLEHAAALNL